VDRGVVTRTGSVGRWAHRHARWLFPAPAVLLVAAIIVYPVVYTIWMSLQEWFASSLTLPRWAGLANYRRILGADPRFRDAVVRTVYFTVLVVVGETVAGVSMALLFNRQFWGRGLLRTLAILPMVATPTAVGLVFVMMYHPTLGVANYLLSVAHLPPFKWTYSSGTALYSLALVDVWQWTPLIMLIALAAFDIIFIITQGGPANASETINILLFNQAFSYFNMGYASSMAVVLFALVMGASLILIKVRRTAVW
jgi:multiple sugar transport system permease protein